VQRLQGHLIARRLRDGAEVQETLERAVGGTLKVEINGRRGFALTGAANVVPLVGCEQVPLADEMLEPAAGINVERPVVEVAPLGIRPVMARQVAAGQHSLDFDFRLSTLVVDVVRPLRNPGP
jgi:hypothetical protein